MTRSPFYLAALVALSAAAFGVNANAQDRVAAQVTMKLSAADQRDAQALNNRLTAAAKLVCDSEVSDPMTAQADKQCEAEAVDTAMRDLNSTRLAQAKPASGSAQNAATFADVTPAN
jgi:UrcA family protein